MYVHLSREIESLKKKILALGAAVEEAVRNSVVSVARLDAGLAKQVIDSDPKIDEKEVEIEEDCLKILALHQPVAVDLRFIVAVLKINNDLERIGDLAVNIAQRGNFLAENFRDKVTFPYDFEDMADKTQQMLKRSLDALVNMDAKLAGQVCAADDDIDNINREVFHKVRDCIAKDSLCAEYMLPLLLVSRHLERIADHATNIAEDVIYMIEGEIIRHRADDYNPD
jgi:phosphate transport system protein